MNYPRVDLLAVLKLRASRSCARHRAVLEIHTWLIIVGVYRTTDPHARHSAKGSISIDAQTRS
jgi:hypothetical protein